VSVRLEVTPTLTPGWETISLPLKRQLREPVEIINRHRKELERACARYRVKALYVFGSVLSERFHPESDIDFLVAIDSNDPLEYAELYFALKFELERIFQRKIDLLELKALRNQRFKSIIDKEKILVFPHPVSA